MEIYGRANALLCQLSGPHGIRASLSDEANYAAVFTRDAVMAGIAGLMCDIDEVNESLVRSLEELRRLQGPEGQIASNYTYASGTLSRVSFGTLSPKIDAATWYIIGVCFCIAKGKLNVDAWRDSIVRVVRLLDALEYNGRHLVYVPTGGNWADEYIDEGYVLYDQVLRAWGLQLAGDLFEVPAWRTKAETIWEVIRVNYWPREALVDHPLVYHHTLYRRQSEYPLAYPSSSFTPAGYSNIFDLAACCLMAIASPEMIELDQALDWIETLFLDEKQLPSVFFPVINPGDAGWDKLSCYYLFTFKNQPFHYHNGGIWWIWLGWLSLAFREKGRLRALDQLCRLTDAQLQAQPSFSFDEYMDGNELRPGGEKMMAYSASGLLMMQEARLAENRGRLRDAWR